MTRDVPRIEVVDLDGPPQVEWRLSPPRRPRPPFARRVLARASLVLARVVLRWESAKGVLFRVHRSKRRSP